MNLSKLTVFMEVKVVRCYTNRFFCLIVSCCFLKLAWAWVWVFRHFQTLFRIQITFSKKMFLIPSLCSYTGRKTSTKSPILASVLPFVVGISNHSFNLFPLRSYKGRETFDKITDSCAPYLMQEQSSISLAGFRLGLLLVGSEHDSLSLFYQFSH